MILIILNPLLCLLKKANHYSRSLVLNLYIILTLEKLEDKLHPFRWFLSQRELLFFAMVAIEVALE